MHSREWMCHIINCSNSATLRSEIAHQLSVDREEWDGAPYDEVSALLDTLQLAEDTLQKALVKNCRRILIDIGFYRVMPAEEVASTVTSNGGAPYAFRMDGTAYTTDFNHDAWIFGEAEWDTPAP